MCRIPKLLFRRLFSWEWPLKAEGLSEATERWQWQGFQKGGWVYALAVSQNLKIGLVRMLEIPDSKSSPRWEPHFSTLGGTKTVSQKSRNSGRLQYLPLTAYSFLVAVLMTSRESQQTTKLPQFWKHTKPKGQSINSSWQPTPMGNSYGNLSKNFLAFPPWGFSLAFCFLRKQGWNWLQSHNLIRTTKYLKLEGTHKNDWVQLPASHRTT